MSRTNHPRTRPTMTALCVVALGSSCVSLCGCAADPYRPQTDSILDFLQGPSPEFVAQMAIDPYDADRRYRGTVLLAGATFAGEEKYMNLFRLYTKDEDSAVRGAAARAVANHGTPEDATYLIPLLDDPDEIVRREAARGLQRLHNTAAIPHLIRKLSTVPQPGSDAKPEDDTQVRADAALALGQYASTTVVEALVTALDDPQLAVNRSTLESLRTLTGQDLGYSRTEWTRWLRSQDQSPTIAQGVFVYPGYERDLKWYEWVPFVPKPRLEKPGVPTGFSLAGQP